MTQIHVQFSLFDVVYSLFCWNDNGYLIKKRPILGRFSVFNTFVEKIQKKLLTKQNGYGILIKLFRMEAVKVSFRLTVEP